MNSACLKSAKPPNTLPKLNPRPLKGQLEHQNRALFERRPSTSGSYSILCGQIPHGSADGTVAKTEDEQDRWAARRSKLDACEKV